jgi:hypothetical protein
MGEPHMLNLVPTHSYLRCYALLDSWTVACVHQMSLGPIGRVPNKGIIGLSIRYHDGT